MKKLMFFLVLFGFGICFAGETWPTWRGPDMMGISDGGNSPSKWSETENIKWKVKLEGDGSSSSPVIWADKIFFTAAIATDEKVAAPATEGKSRGRGPRVTKAKNIFKFDLLCLDRKTGKTLWQKTLSQTLPHQGHHPDHGFSSFSPVTDGKHVWVSLGSFGVYCYDLDGKKVWSKEMPQLRNRWGEASSPVLAADALIVVADQEDDSFIYAFEKKTGKEIWTRQRDEISGWTTPITADVDGQLQVIVNGGNRVRSYDAKNGDLIWQCGGQTRNALPAPVTGLGMVFCASGFRGNALLAIKLGRKGELTDSDAIAWQVNKATPYVPSPLLYKDKLYVCSGNNGILSCYDAKTGKPYFVKQKLEEIKGVYASPTAAAGRVYITGRNGVVYVIKPYEKLEVIAVNKLDDDIDCSPAFVGDEMYLKGKKYLYCIAK